MEEQMIKISKREYEGMKETIEILQNSDLMRQILESERDIRQGRIKEIDSVNEI
jgi:PHD/YefM family antitoxin component YafN of YafNO toxin-antitoxin module